MIGGVDIRVAVPTGPEALDFAVRAILRRWKNAVVVADRNPNLLSYDQLEFHGDHLEMIVYKSKDICDLWRKHGYDESLKGTMIYLISDPTDLTLVIEDDPSSETQLIVRAIQQGIAATFEGNYLHEMVA